MTRISESPLGSPGICGTATPRQHLAMAACLFALASLATRHKSDKERYQMSTRTLALACAAAAALLAGSIDAQACPGRGPFSGPYIGLNAGVGWARTKQSDVSGTLPVDPSQSGDDSSFTGGGQVGYNIQCGQVVFGI